MIRSIPADFLAVVRDGFRIWWLAPLVPLLVVLPEAIQHVAEIRLGMFESRAQAIAVSGDPRRMVWGYLKIAGLVLAILAAVRFWAARRSGGTWWNLRGLAWRQLGIAIALIGLTAVPGLLLEPRIGEQATGWIDTGLMIATLPLFALLVAGLAGDRTATLAGVFRTGWLAALRIALFAAAVWLPLAWLHGMNHRWAMGAAEPLLWLLMSFDALVVGLLATMAGTAIHHGYASPTRPDCAPVPVPASGAAFTPT